MPVEQYMGSEIFSLMQMFTCAQSRLVYSNDYSLLSDLHM
jgi:hypothetical protein